MKQIHFYTYEPFYTDCVHSFAATKALINKRENDIHTTQMGLLDKQLFKLGYSIFIHESVIDSYELVIDSFRNKCGRKLNLVDIYDDLFIMWCTGAFKENRKD